MHIITAKPQYTSVPVNLAINASISINNPDAREVKMSNGSYINENFMIKLYAALGGYFQDNPVQLRNKRNGYIPSNIMFHDGKFEGPTSFVNILKSLKRSIPEFREMNDFTFQRWAFREGVVQLWENYFLNDWSEDYRPCLDINEYGNKRLTCIHEGIVTIKLKGRYEVTPYTRAISEGGEKVELVLSNKLIHQFDKEGNWIKVHMGKRYAAEYAGCKAKELVKALQYPQQRMHVSGSRWSLEKFYPNVHIARGAILKLGPDKRVVSAYRNMQHLLDWNGVSEEYIRTMLKDGKSWSIYDPE